MSDSKQFPVAGRLCGATILAACATALALAGIAHAQSGDRAAIGEYQVKAAFLYHFTKFVEWPAAATNGNVVVVGVLGDDPFGPALDFLFEDKVLKGKRFRVQRFSNAEQARSCQILFVSIPNPHELKKDLDALAGSPVLTVGDSNDFLAAGGMIYLFVDESKIHFDVNLGTARQSHLALSAALLRLARKVEGR
jgi:YfiR/HmsC-like